MGDEISKKGLSVFGFFFFFYECGRENEMAKVKPRTRKQKEITAGA
jgi:hypothetical protein